MRATQQAGQFVDRGFRLGIGGAMTYSGSQRIRRHARELPDHAWVLETDAPLHPAAVAAPSTARSVATSRSHLPRIAPNSRRCAASSLTDLAAQNRANAVAALPRLGAWLAASNA